MLRHTSPSVSIVIPTHNRASYLQETLASVFAQTLIDFEVIIVDDGSTDETRSRLNEIHDPRLRYFYQEKQGRSAARNLGWLNSLADYILFLDSDDLLLPDAAELLVNTAYQFSNFGAIGAGYKYLIDDEIEIEIRPWFGNNLLNLTRMLTSCPFVMGGTIIKKSCLQQIGGFDTSLEFSEDWDLWIRLSMVNCEMRWLEKTIMKYRLHRQPNPDEVSLHASQSIRILEKFYSQDSIPQEAIVIKKHAYASIYTLNSASKYGVNDIAGGKEDLLLAGKYMPEWIDTGELVEAILRQADNPLITLNPAEFESRFLSNLPDQLSDPKIIKSAIARKQYNHLLIAIRNNNQKNARKYWWDMVLNDPRWFKNRGVWAIGLRLWRSYLKSELG